MRALVAVAQARIGNAWLRAGSCAVVALIATSIIGNAWPLAWFAGLAVVLIVDHTIYKRVFKACAAQREPERMKRLIAWTVLQSSYGNALAAMLYFAKYVHGETLAVIYLLGGIANAAATLRMHTPLAIAGVAPTIAFLLGLPLVDYFFVGTRNELDLMPFVGGLMVLAFGMNLWKTLLASDAAQAQAEAAVMRERQSAAAAAVAKTETIRRMNAELRTPMAALIGAAEHLRRAAISSEARQHIGAIVQAGDVIRLVLDDLSDLDRLENGEIKVEARPTDPRELAKSVVGAFRASAHDKGIELFLDISQDVPALVAIDPLRVRQVLFNLVANAVRFTSHGGVRVRLQVQPCESARYIRLGFVVADTGAGMSRARLAFVLGRDRTSHDGDGPGLGLSISMRLARLMGARLAAKSELGEGSVFSFVIEAPMLEAAPRSAA